ncbi:MAG: type I DNA topoisomerase [Chloroflexi bacterium]|nr:type I DNA topoisomerase [Chloroflexota bacterium]
MPDASDAGSGNGKTLVIVESGAKADTISRFLDDDYVVSACFGHVRDLPRRAAERPAKIKGQPWADLAVDVDHGFQPYYIVPSESKKHVTRLRKELRQADRVLLATDEDREGESIGWHLLEVLKPKVPYERIVFHEITPTAIEQALESPRDIDGNLVEAQESRRILDRLYGYSLSPVLWRKLGQGTSAGRVQSVALKFLVERERERMAFVSAEYWGANADFAIGDSQLSARLLSLGGVELASQTSDFDPTTGQLAASNKRWETEESLEDIRPTLVNADWLVSTIAKTQARMRPAPPFTTSTMQQAASNRLGMGAARAMAAAQRLYQGVDLGAERVGLITYMRTDSVTLSDQALAQAANYIQTTYGDDYHQFRTYKTRSRNAQEAHEAIRPTDIARTPDSLRGVLDGDDFALYDLIWRRSLACQMADAQVERTRIELEAQLTGRPADDPAVMIANGQVVLFPGWYEVLPPRGDGQQLLPDVNEGEPAQLINFEPKRSDSQPPARYTEATLVKKLEDDGLGRPSTYAAIIKTLTDRNYVTRSGRTLIPTFLGFGVIDLLTQHFADLVNAEFTADMEDTLDQIARGEARAEQHLHEFYFGDDGSESGLKGRVAEKIDTIPFWALNLDESGLSLDLDGDDHVGPDDIQVRIRGGSSFIRRGVGDSMRTAPLPPDMAPADLTLAQAGDLLETTLQLPRKLGHHPDYDDDVWLLNGRFGPFVQLGEAVGRPKRGQPKPRRASVPKDMELPDVNLEHAIEWLRWPKTLGEHPESGEEVTVRPGRWGPYVQSGDERRNLKDEDDLETIDLDRALALLAEPKAPRRGGGRRGGRRSGRRR